VGRDDLREVVEGDHPQQAGPAECPTRIAASGPVRWSARRNAITWSARCSALNGGLGALLEPRAPHAHPGGQSPALAPRSGAHRDDAKIALAELASLISVVPDPELRDQLSRVHQALPGTGVLVPGAGTRATGTRTLAHGADILAPRERGVLRMAATGASNLEIAARLGLRPQTVKAYMRAAMGKLGAHNRTAAVHAARLADAL
jgi:DNA-binding CsgD family transcriptional regulator